MRQNVRNHEVRCHGRDLFPFNGYRGQLFYAAACIRSGLHAQAEAHLCNALGAANVSGDKHALGNIMTALNHVRRVLRRDGHSPDRKVLSHA